MCFFLVFFLAAIGAVYHRHMFATKPRQLYGKDTDGCSAIHEYVLSGLKSRPAKKALATSVGGTSERSEGKQSGRSRLHADRKSTRLNSSHVAISYAVF